MWHGFWDHSRPKNYNSCFLENLISLVFSLQYWNIYIIFLLSECHTNADCTETNKNTCQTMSPYECTCNSGFVPDDDGPGCVGKLKNPNTEAKGTTPSVYF